MLLFGVILGSCNLLSPADDLAAEQIASTMVAETALASETKAPATPTSLPPTQTQAPPTDVPTSTPLPEPTRTPGPLVLQDDFSRDSGFWECDECSFENGRLHFGPYPVSGAFIQHFVICSACGMVTTYRMSADVLFGDGPSERGYGFLVRGTEDYILTYEITPWQDLDFWNLDYETDEWTWINGIFAGAVRPGKQVNRIEIEVSASPSGGVDISLTVNGKTPLVIFNQPSDAGAVGFTLYGHAVDIFFDNFAFETDEDPVFPQSYEFLDA